MLMDMPSGDRYDFLKRITEGQAQRFHKTHDGDPDIKLRLKLLLRDIYTTNAIANWHGAYHEYSVRSGTK